MNLEPDEEILTLLRDKDSCNQGFNLLVRTYQEKIYWLVRKILISHEDTNDTVQNVFIKIWKHINTFREESKLSTWIYRIAVNEALLFLKTKKLLNFIPYFSVEKKLANSLLDDNYFEADEIQLKLQKEILALPQKQRLVFNMRYFDDLSFDEISNILGTSEGALKASYHIAFKKIEKNLLSN
ncbi:MAG: sigma-70 family RNA polymerase sigma factor [Bacteroidota bacterium]